MAKFGFEILWVRNGLVEPLFKPDPTDLPSIETARELAMRFASYATALHSISIEAEDASISERWSRVAGEWGPFPQRTQALRQPLEQEADEHA
jgi:hypothetical protein